eukprot:CAMPEP_0115210452 /NCGR_PEP_ID=MMETSP0270-20121206/22256_1 /TAXON_ID=71861 /ORGANISM="Scrippsiella trochoidea, Strain CCMP3099" /LENGTH=84 /DNA_ID=CAMNT_0002624111 /DNA_START=130 /DNA_END=381 /DNA_ORIENTATION=-
MRQLMKAADCTSPGFSVLVHHVGDPDALYMRKMPTKRYKYGQAMNFLRVIIAMQALLAPSETTLPGKNSSHQHKSCSAAVLVSP